MFLRIPIRVAVVITLIAGCAAAPPQSVEYATPESTPIQIPPELRQPSGDKKLAAVVGMENKSIFRSDLLWDATSDLLTTRLVEIGYFRVIDWHRMKSQFDLSDLRSASLVSTPDRLLNVRNQLACDYFVGGAITFYDVAQTGEVSAISKSKTITTTVRVDLWIQDAQTGEYLSSASGNGKATQQFTGGLTGGVIGTWDANVANKSLTLAIDDALIRLLKTYNERQQFSASKLSAPAKKLSRHPLQSVMNPNQFRRNSNKWAIVIGVANFADPVIAPLNYSDQDALAMYEYLTDPNNGNFMTDQVFLIVNEDATTLRIKNAIEIISKHAQPDDMVVIFVSTHGTPSNIDIEGVGYLVTYDTLTYSLYSTAFSMSDLVNAVQNRIRANSVITIMDSCYSANALNGTVYLTKGSKDLIIETEQSHVPQKMIDRKLETQGVGVSQSTAQALASGQGRVFITSSLHNQKSWESDTLHQGFFTYYLLEGLKMKGGKIKDAFEYLSASMPTAVMKEKNHPQNPVMKGRGDIQLNSKPMMVN